ncbi:hypothetical protein FGIG_07512 [Fasciola gigantica]|uniref:CRAL-TRIO domain-containing protein n=1 Tax=Fasciola gigantica TaxID=46835 RepID=A0A504YVX2_FASGI|nr:hypothetical protein FGIG_07512 [Fasciola gigantica]
MSPSNYRRVWHCNFVFVRTVIAKSAWQAIKPFLPQTTVAKVTMVNNKSQLKNVLEQHFSPSMIRWIQTEYKLNRQKPTYLRYRNSISSTDSRRSEHDPRGEISYVRPIGLNKNTHPGINHIQICLSF